MRRAAFALVLLTGCVGGMQPPAGLDRIVLCVAECATPELTRCAVECASVPTDPCGGCLAGELCLCTPMDPPVCQCVRLAPEPAPVSLREAYPEGEVVMLGEGWPDWGGMSLCPSGSRIRSCELPASAAICCEPVP